MENDTLGYHQIYARYVPRIPAHEQKVDQMQICQDLTIDNRRGGDIFRDRVITGDETLR